MLKPETEHIWNFLPDQPALAGFEFEHHDDPVAVLEKGPKGHGPRLATLDELFRSESLLTASRSKTRDWFDRFVLMIRGGYSLADYHEAFRIGGIASQAAIGLRRLCSGKPQASDEGFESLRSLQSPSLIINHLQQRKLPFGVFPERFLKDFPLIPGRS
jgi:hypothetical protein